MERWVFGGTGISVSGFALGTMMLGAMGNTDHDESIRMIHTALDAGINFVDTADVYSRGESPDCTARGFGSRAAFPYGIADYLASPLRAECISIFQSSAPRVRSCRAAMRHPSGRRTTESW